MKFKTLVIALGPPIGAVALALVLHPELVFLAIKVEN